MRITRLPVAFLLLSAVGAWAAPAAPAAEPSGAPLSLGKFKPGMRREEAKAAGQVNCRPERRNTKGEPAEVRCDVPADQAKLGNLKVLSATISYEQPGFSRVTTVVLRAAGRAGPNQDEVARALGVRLMPGKRKYVASAGGVQVTVSDDLEEPETVIVWRAEAQPDPKVVAKQAEQAKADKALLKGF